MWPILSYRDARTALTFLTDAFGFEQRGAYVRDDDPSIIEHAEMRWPFGGGIMFGTAGKDGSPFGHRIPGNDSVYVVCDEPDTLFKRAVTRLALRDRIFAMQKGNFPGGQPSLWLKAHEGAEGALVGTAPDRFFVPPYVGHRGWVGVHVDGRRVDWDELPT